MSAGARLLRDAGSPADTRLGPRSARTCRAGAGGRTSPGPAATSATTLGGRAGAARRPGGASRRGRETGWVKLVGDWTDRDTGDLSPCRPADVVARPSRWPTRRGPRDRALLGEQSLRDLAVAGPTGVEPPVASKPDHRGLRRAGHRHRPDPGQHRHLPQIVQPAVKFPDHHRHTLDLHARRYETVAAAREAGIPVLANGCRWLAPPPRGQRHRGGALAHVGFTDVGRRWTPPPGGADPAWVAGSEEGAEADLVVHPQDPREDLVVLAAPSLVVPRDAVAERSTTTAIADPRPPSRRAANAISRSVSAGQAVGALRASSVASSASMPRAALQAEPPR